MTNIFKYFREKFEIKRIGKKRINKILDIMNRKNLTSQQKIDAIKKLKLSKFTEERLILHIEREGALKEGEHQLRGKYT